MVNWVFSVCSSFLSQSEDLHVDWTGHFVCPGCFQQMHGIDLIDLIPNPNFDTEIYYVGKDIESTTSVIKPVFTDEVKLLNSGRLDT